jgi:hypothetical protein
MRFIFGVIIGIALTVGAAYVHDRNLPAQAASPVPADPTQPALPVPAARSIVNWDVVDTITKEQTAYVKGLWDKAFGSL